MAHLNQHLVAAEREQAQHWLGMWRNAAPNDPGIRSFEERLRRG
jgi:hypothetical protein